jgi:hypothetical protein
MPVLFILFQTFAVCGVSFHLDGEEQADQQVMRKQFLSQFAYSSACWSTHSFEIKEKTAFLVAKDLHPV